MSKMNETKTAEAHKMSNQEPVTAEMKAAKPRKSDVRLLATVIRCQHLGGEKAQVLFDEKGKCFAHNMDGGYSSLDRHHNGDYLLSELEGDAYERAYSTCQLAVERLNEMRINFGRDPLFWEPLSVGELIYIYCL